MFDTKMLIDYGGLLLIFLVVYGQTGLFFCFFIPSGAFMFAAGAMLASGMLDCNLITASSLLVVAAILGNMTGYFFGKKAGPLFYNRPDSRFFKKEHLATAENFYDKYGGRALSIGLFLPIIRTFSPIVAGMVRLNFRRFVWYVTLGSVSWVLSFLLAGYLIGSRPFFKPYIKYIVTGIVCVVTIPVVIRIIKEFKKKKEAV